VFLSSVWLQLLTWLDLHTAYAHWPRWLWVVWKTPCVCQQTCEHGRTTTVQRAWYISTH